MSDKSNSDRQKARQSAEGNIVAALVVGAVVGSVALISSISSYYWGKRAATQEHNENSEKIASDRVRESQRRLANAPVQAHCVDDEVPLCKLCYEHVANIVFRPCSHQCTCPICAQQLAQDSSSYKCPVCRVPIEALEVVYPQ